MKLLIASSKFFLLQKERASMMSDVVMMSKSNFTHSAASPLLNKEQTLAWIYGHLCKKAFGFGENSRIS